jgi:hypothetical protein
MKPSLIKANITVSFLDRKLEFEHKAISRDGIHGLRWNPIYSVYDLKTPVVVQIQTLVEPSLSMKIHAFMVREKSADSSSMGLSFNLNEEDYNRLSFHIQKHGYTPPSSTRGSPRLPSVEFAKTFPAYAAVDSDDDALGGYFPVVLRVMDLSMKGLLLEAKDIITQKISPGTPLKITLEPRGWFPSPVQSKGVIRRVMDTISLDTHQPVRYLGIELSKMNEANKLLYKKLLQSIVDDMKSNMKAGAKSGSRSE